MNALQQALERILADKTSFNQKTFLQQLAFHSVYLAAITSQTTKETHSATDNDIFSYCQSADDGNYYLKQKHANQSEFLLGFSTKTHFNHWQSSLQNSAQLIIAKHVDFSVLCQLMKHFEQNELGLLINPGQDNLILENAIFNHCDYFISPPQPVHANDTNKKIVMLSPLEIGDFSFDLLKLMHHQFLQHLWVDQVWAATTQINGTESFLLIIKVLDPNEHFQYEEKSRPLYDALSQTCADFFQNTQLSLINHTVMPFDAVTAHYEPIFAKKQV